MMQRVERNKPEHEPMALKAGRGHAAPPQSVSISLYPRRKPAENGLK
jgi:hypothetical protein